MGQAALVTNDVALDTVITNALIVDAVSGIIKADVGIKVRARTLRFVRSPRQGKITSALQGKITRNCVAAWAILTTTQKCMTMLIRIFPPNFSYVDDQMLKLVKDQSRLDIRTY